jgi:hypothetical protein
MIDGEQRGPVSLTMLQGLLSHGALPVDAYVWCDGMADWVPAHSVSALRRCKRQSAAHGEIASAWGQGTQVRPWIRLVARTIDVMLFSVVASIVLGSFLTQSAVEGNILLPVMLLALYAVFEAYMLSAWGTTPGKKLLRTRVRRLDGRLLSYREALMRSLYVWIRGVGMGLPIVGVVAQFWSYNELMVRGVTSWDKYVGCRVEHAEIPQARLVVAVSIFMLGLVLAIAGATGAVG